jgi:hypothetical protein
LDKDINEPMSEFHQIEYGADFDLEGSVDRVGQEGDSLHMDYDRRALMYAMPPPPNPYPLDREMCYGEATHVCPNPFPFGREMCYGEATHVCPDPPSPDPYPLGREMCAGDRLCIIFSILARLPFLKEDN